MRLPSKRGCGTPKSRVVVLFQTAPVDGGSTLYNFSVNPDRTPTVRMPRIKDLWRLRTTVFDCREGNHQRGERDKSRRDSWRWAHSARVLRMPGTPMAIKTDSSQSNEFWLRAATRTSFWLYGKREVWRSGDGELTHERT